VGDERATLDDWLAGRVPRKTREERKADWERRTQVRQREWKRQRHILSARRDLYRRALEP